ncbi:MAG: hypothetical protein JSW10_07940 [Pseudomonadota bacterium]|nr:MAG: hypothetical protein JSW10_07940 [Pseudomonadota bacterium]
MSSDSLKVPKTLKEVSLWVHPEGRVVGSLFLRERGAGNKELEQPLDVLNRASPFLVLQREQPDELRFYNRASIIRVEYRDETPTATEGTSTLPCELMLMDGSVLDGSVREELPPDHARLFDYLNQSDNQFLRIFFDDGGACLVNKSYIIYVRTTQSTA